MKKKILSHLYHHETISGPALSNRMGVSLPTALTLLNELAKTKLIEVRGSGVSKGGRKPTIFGLSSDLLCIVACELGRFNGKIIIYNWHNQPVSKIKHFDTSIDDDHLVDKIYKNTVELIREHNIDKDKIAGIGLIMPGLVDEKEGINYTIKNTEYQNVKQRMEEKFGKMIYINNDARMQAYGEYIFGAAHGYKNAAIVNWSWGIGLGLILDGKLYNGSNGFAGELSHTKFTEGGDLCICGKTGCLETIASANVLIRTAIDAIKKGQVSQLTEKFKNRPDELELMDIIKAAKAGDEYSILLLNQIGLALGKGLSFTIQLLNPDIIVIGGPISAANQYVLIPIQQSLNKYCLEQIYRNTKIVISESWEQAGLLGISAIMFQKLFSDMTG